MSEEGELLAPARALIEGLEGEGEAVGGGHFTLDTHRALVKLRDYQLADPRTYILLVIEAAFVASAGTTQVRIERGRETTIEFDGLPVDADTLDQIFAAVFRKDEPEGERGSRRASESLRLLALALNGALALEPTRVSLEIADHQGRVHVAEFDREREFFVTRHIRDGPPGRTWFRLERGALFGATDSLAILSLIRERCRYSRLSIFVDGKLVSEGQRAAATAREHGPMPELPLYFEGRVIGYGGFTREVQPDEALIYSQGVRAKRLPLPTRRGYIAVVEVDLAKDLSRQQLVRDERLAAVQEAIRAASQAAGPRPIEAGPLDHAQAPRASDMTVPLALTLPFIAVLMVLGLGMAISEYRNQREADRILAQRASANAKAQPSPAHASPAPSPARPTPVAELTRGLRTLPSPSRPPGNLLVTAPGFAVARAGQTDAELTLIAASSWGRGRVVALAAPEWLREARVVTNASRWAQGPEQPAPLALVCALDGPVCEDLDVRVFGREPAPVEDWVAALSRAGVLVIEAERLSSSADRRALEAFVRAGGGLVIAGHGRAWLRRHPGSSLADYPGNQLLREVGLAWGDEALEPSDPQLRLEPAPEP